MELADAWLKILGMENCDRFNSNQIHSILADLGVFKTNPRVRLVLKTALTYGLWDIIINYRESGNKVDILRLKLQNDGYSETIVYEILRSFSSYSFKKDTPNSKVGLHQCPIEDNKTTIQSHISFLGKELGCDIKEMVAFLVNRGFKRININDTPKRISLKGTFAGIDDCEVFIWKTISNKVWSIVINLKATFQFIKDLFDSKYCLVERQNYIGKYTCRLIYSTPGGEITIGHSWYDNRISYVDYVTAILNDNEIAAKNLQIQNSYNKKLKNAAKEI